MDHKEFLKEQQLAVSFCGDLNRPRSKRYIDKFVERMLSSRTAWNTLVMLSNYNTSCCSLCAQEINYIFQTTW